MSAGKKGEQASPPWWRVPMMWLVVGGPLAVVVASVTTFALAWQGADAVVSEAPNPVAPASGHATPAVQARNHVADARAR